MSFTTTKPSVGDPTKQSFASAIIDNDTEMRDRSVADLLRCFGDFEDWTNGTTVAPDQWTLSGAGATIARDGTNFKIGTYSAAVTRVGADAQLALNASTWVGGTGYYRSRVFTLGAWVRATVASRARIRLNDGVAQQASAFHTGGEAWEWLTVTITAAALATQLQAELQVNTGDTTAQFDGVVLVEGTTVPPASSIRGVGSSGSIASTMIADDAVTLAKIAAGTAGNLITYDASGNPAAVATGTAEYPLVAKGPGVVPVFQQLLAAGIANDAVGLAKLAAGTAGNLITYDASGNPAAVATGTVGQVLTSNGVGLPPTMQTAGGASVAAGIYTGNGSEGRAIAHGMGVVPKGVFIMTTAGAAAVRMGGTIANKSTGEGSDGSGQTTVTAADATNFYITAYLNLSSSPYSWFAVG